MKLRRKHGAAGYGIYLMILERLAEDSSHVAELDYEVLAFDFHEDPALIRSVVEDFDLFEIDLEAETFAHEEITRQGTPKPKRQPKEAEKGQTPSAESQPLARQGPDCTLAQGCATRPGLTNVWRAVRTPN